MPSPKGPWSPSPDQTAHTVRCPQGSSSFYSHSILTSLPGRKESHSAHISRVCLRYLCTKEKTSFKTLLSGGPAALPHDLGSIPNTYILGSIPNTYTDCSTEPSLTVDPLSSSPAQPIVRVALCVFSSFSLKKDRTRFNSNARHAGSCL